MLSRMTWVQCAFARRKDWLLIIILALVLLLLEKGLPARRMEITEQMESHIMFPFLKSTVPSFVVPIYSFLGPIAVVSGHMYLTKGPPSISHAGTLCALVSVLLTADITNLFKIMVCPRALRGWSPSGSGLAT